MLKQLILISFCIFSITVIAIYLLQRHLIYFPTKTPPNRHFFHADDMESLQILTSDHLQLHAWYKVAAPKKPTLLYLHGNAGHIGFRMPFVRQLLDEGWGVLLLDYRGYGGNQGEPTEPGLYEDGRSAMRWLLQHDIQSEHIVLYGESLGTGVATQIANEYKVCAVVLQSPFTSLTALARYHYPWAFLPPWDKFDSLKRISTTHAPILFLHGTDDQIVPYAQGQTLFQAANEPKEWVMLPGKGHNDLWDADFVGHVIQFIAIHCQH
jgi:fermentation-respiration switch protein FrsA (DUF1100 family)